MATRSALIKSARSYGYSDEAPTLDGIKKYLTANGYEAPADIDAMWANVKAA
jgi:hypothetical protein